MTEQGPGLLGSSAVIPEDDRYLHNQRIGLLHDINETKADKKFLYYLFNTAPVRGQIAGSATGTKVRHTAPERIYRVNVRIPAVAQQRQIAAALTAYDELIENNRRRIALLEEAARLLYREWFVQFRFPGHEHVKIIDGVPDGWAHAVLSDLVNLVKETARPDQISSEDIHIGLEHIPRRSFTLSDWDSAEGLQSIKFRFKERDILFGKIRPYFHKTGFALLDGLCSSDALVLRAIDESLWSFALCTTSSDYFVAVASKTVREGSKMPRADWSVLKNFKIALPPMHLLEDFNSHINPITDACRAMALLNRQLSKAREILLPRLMDGRLEI